MIILFLMIVGFSLISPIGEAFSTTERDRDQDGILDEFDECPLTSETYNKFQDFDGCPDSIDEDITPYQFPDIDGDGIEDRLDSCPYLPETLNDYLDFDGCPEIVPNTADAVVDSDFDSIADEFDNCPLEKEIFNGFQDDDGCPDPWSSPTDDSSTNTVIIENQCREDKVLVFRVNTNEMVCIPFDTAQRWESYGIVTIIEIPSAEETVDEIMLPIIEDDVIVVPEEILTSNSTEIIQKTDYTFVTRSDKEKRNIETIIDFFSGLSPWNEKIVSGLVADDYVEHNPTMTGNKTGLLETLEKMFTTELTEPVKYDLKRIYADEDYVITHSHFQGNPGVDVSVIDIFRINEPGKIIEHWDIIQEIPDTSMNNNTMFYLD